ncbi:MAG: helix-turn-helix domain-containing protein [Flavobacteriaceae bacterium]
MSFNSELLFFFSALGAFNGIILSIYILIVGGKKHRGNIFLGIALIMLCVRATKSLFFYFNDNLFEPFIQIGIIACFFIGPFLYFFIYTACDPLHKTPPWWKQHLLVLVPTILVLTLLFPYYTYRSLWSHNLMVLIYLQWLAYLLLSARLLTPFVIKPTRQHVPIKPIVKWAIHVFSGFSLVWLAYFTAGYTSYIVGAITFTVMLYLLILLLINKKKKQIFLLDKTQLSPEKKRAQKALLYQVELLFNEQQLYKQVSIKSDTVARSLGIPTYQLSQIINDQLGMNFNSYVNKFRVAAAKKMLQSNPEYTIDAIGKECGFKSKSSFYAAFKKETGTTPSKFV